MTSPLPTDEDREALADLIEGVGVYVPGSHGHDYINPNRAAEAVLAWMEREGFRRSVVSTPDPEATKLIADARRFAHEGRMAPAPSHAFILSLADALEASSVSAPPTITDEEAARVIEDHLRDAVRMGIGWPKTGYLDRWIVEKVKSLRASLGGEEKSHG